MIPATKAHTIISRGFKTIRRAENIGQAAEVYFVGGKELLQLNRNQNICTPVHSELHQSRIFSLAAEPEQTQMKSKK